MYRSFVRCDDPKGVVECKTIRKSKTSIISEGKIKTDTMHNNLNHPSTKHNNEDGQKELVCEGTAEDLQQNPSFFQVSKGADSWAKGITFDCHSKEVARDLLKGALDLQESLVMLGKIEAASYMAKLKKKSKVKSRGGKFDEMANSNRFVDEGFQNGFQNSSLSTSEPPLRDCYDELREVIRDSFARQNLLPKNCSKEKAYCDGDTSSSSEAKVPFKKSGSPNLIAKLMGLEEFPHNRLQSNPRKPVDINKISNQRRPLFEMDMPKMRKTEVVFQKPNPHRRTLKEVLETFQYNGLLKSDSVDRFNPPFHDFTTCSEQGSTDDVTPIVVIKPIHSSVPEEGEVCKKMCSGETRGLETKEVLRRLKVKEGFPPRAVEYSRERVFDERPRHEKAKGCEEILAKPEEKRFGTKEKSASKIEASATVNRKERKKETIQKNAEKTQKVAANRQKPVQTDNAKSNGVYGSQVHAKAATRKLNNPKEISNATKSRTTEQKRTTSSPLKAEHTTPTMSHTSTAQKRKLKTEKAVMKPLAANLAKKVQSENATEGNNAIVESECSPTKANIASTCHVPNEEKADPPNNQIKELPNDSHSSASEEKPQTRQTESKPSSSEESVHCIITEKTENKFFKTAVNQKNVLLSSPSFLARAEELFNMSTDHQCINFQAEGDIDYEITETRLFLDYANELVELKIVGCSGTPNLLSHASSARTCNSLDQLAAEICDGVERLRSYSKFAGENFSVDNLIGILERDLWYKGVVSGTWDLGWRDGFSWDEVEHVVGDIEKLLLSSLLEELLTGLV